MPLAMLPPAEELPPPTASMPPPPDYAAIYAFRISRESQRRFHGARLHADYAACFAPPPCHGH